MATKKQSGRLNWKGAILLVLAAGLIFLTIAPARQVLRQRAQIADLQRTLNSVKDENKGLRDETSRLNTDAYIEQQARLRLGLIKPGEQPYMIVPPKQVAVQPAPKPVKKKAAAPAKPVPWYQQIADYFNSLFK
jgi:cell division protein FtsB